MGKEQSEVEEIIKTTVKELLEKMGFDCELSLTCETETEDAGTEKENIVCDIKTTESNFLIGQYGVNLQSLQHIARVLIRKKIQDRINFVLDVNSYRKEKNLSIIAMAKNSAQQALNEKRVVVLRPMSSYERRLVHMELSKNIEVITESIGEGEDRRIVIKPANTI